MSTSKRHAQPDKSDGSSPKKADMGLTKESYDIWKANYIYTVCTQKKCTSGFLSFLVVRDTNGKATHVVPVIPDDSNGYFVHLGTDKENISVSQYLARKDQLGAKNWARAIVSSDLLSSLKYEIEDKVSSR